MSIILSTYHSLYLIKSNTVENNKKNYKLFLQFNTCAKIIYNK